MEAAARDPSAKREYAPRAPPQGMGGKGRATNGPGAPRARAGSEIVPGLFVGGSAEAARFSGTKICVLDHAPAGTEFSAHVPIYDAATDRVLPEALDRVSQLIADAQKRGEPVLVFCGHGVRRSPLSVAWHLRRTQQLSLDEAYARLRAVRPIVEDARDWVGDPTGL
jgi:hypothetical protein